MVKFVGIICDECKKIGPGVIIPWLDLSDNNTEIQQSAKRKGWQLKGLKDLCPFCIEPEVVKPTQPKFKRTGNLKKVFGRRKKKKE